MWHSASICSKTLQREQEKPTESRTDALRGNEQRTNREKGRNWVPIPCQKLNNDLLVRYWPEFDSDHFQSRKKRGVTILITPCSRETRPRQKRGVAKCDTLLLIFEWKFHHLSYGQICPKVPLFQLRQKCLIALLFALCSKKSVTGDLKRFPDLESKNALTPYFTADKIVCRNFDWHQLFKPLIFEQVAFWKLNRSVFCVFVQF